MIRKTILVSGVLLIAAGGVVALLINPYPLPSDAEAERMRDEVAESLGTSLESVTVEPVRMSGITDDSGKTIVGFHVAYTLNGSDARASNYTQTEWGVELILPPSTGPQLAASRFTALADAFTAKTSKPIGTVVPLIEYSDGGTFTTTEGTSYPIDELWIVTVGFDSIEELAENYTRDAGFLFHVPPSGPIVATGLAPAGVIRADIGD